MNRKGAKLPKEYQLFIGGEYCPPSGGEWFDSLNPYPELLCKRRHRFAPEKVVEVPTAKYL